jgi:hypothetical protein
MDFKNWLEKIKENMTSTADVATFARPLFSEPVRRKAPKIEEEKKKKS